MRGGEDRPEGGRGNARFDDAQGDGVGESGSADGRDSQTDEELGSVRSEQIESSTLLVVRAGVHCPFNISKQMPPFEFILQ